MLVSELLQHNALPVEQFLRAMFVQYSSPLYRLMEYQLGWRDERGSPLETSDWSNRLHSSLCLLAAQAMGGDPQKAVPAAAAVELIYQFAQVHGDIQEGSQRRHDQPTVWWIWGPAQAINAGDGLHALARLALLQEAARGREASESLGLLQALDTACLRMLEGLHQELIYQERVDITPEEYLKTAREKGGALFGCALELGAMAVNSPPRVASSLRQFGESLGTAFQIQEDIQMLWGKPLSGKVVGLDTLNKKKGFPVVYALSHAPIPQRRELGTLYFKRVLEPPDLQRVTALLDGLDCRSTSQAVVQQLLAEALQRFEDSGLPREGRKDLMEVARWLALREE